MASASIQITEPFLSQVERVREEMRAKFLKSHQILQQREAALTSELDQLVANYRVEKIKEQMRDLDRMKESLKSTVECEENKEVVEASVALMKRRRRELEVSLETLLDKMWGVELDWKEELECSLSEIGEIKLIAAPALIHEKESTGSMKCILDTYDIKIRDVRDGVRYFEKKRDETRTISFSHSKGECCICFDHGGLKMPCGHYICPDDMLKWAWIQIKYLKHEFNCPQCSSILSIEDIIKFGLPTEEEKQFIMTALSVNFCESQDIVQCPNCSSYSQRMNPECPRMECTVCAMKGKKNTFCWYCLSGWNKLSKYQDSCGNADCRRKDFEALRNYPKENLQHSNGKLITIPLVRACPHCFTIVEYVKGSYHMNCRNCSKKFCFICLEKAIDGSMLCHTRGIDGIKCSSAPVQNKLRP